MLRYLKLFWWDWRHETGRFNLICGLLRNLPGSPGMEARARYIPRFFAEAGQNVRIHAGVRFRGAHKIRAGNNVLIGVDNFLQASGGLVLGNDVMLGPGVKIWTINHRFGDPKRPIREQGYDYEEVVLGDGVWVGANAFILPGVHIPEGCIVSAASVVAKKKYPPYSILAGYPARVVGNRRPDSTPARPAGKAETGRSSNPAGQPPASRTGCTVPGDEPGAEP